MSLEKARIFPGSALNAVEQPVDVGRKAVPGRLPSGADRICIQISSTVAASSSVLPEK